MRAAKASLTHTGPHRYKFYSGPCASLAIVSFRSERRCGSSHFSGPGRPCHPAAFLGIFPSHFLVRLLPSLWSCCCSVALSCLTLSDPMDHSMPGFPVLTLSRSLLKLMSIESGCHPTTSSSVDPFTSCLQSFPASRSFPMSQLFASGGRSIGVSTSTSVLPMNIQGCTLESFG